MKKRTIISKFGVSQLGFGEKTVCLSPQSALFEITFLSPGHERVVISSALYKNITISGDHYIFDDADTFDCTITVLLNETDEDKKCFRINIDNRTGYIIESINFPILEIDCEMRGTGGKDTIFWPSMEGVLIEKPSNEYFRLAEESLGAGYCGITPGSATMQYMAFLSDKGCLYYGAHDEICTLKDFEYRFINDNKVQFICKIYPDGCKSYQMPFDMVIGSFEGDWQQAAEIYRCWLETSNIPLPAKLSKRNDLPEWMEDSPVTMLYCVRGNADTDRDERMCPNCYYPYTNILPVIDEYAEKFDSRIMPLLMHWEGSAPWATPYVWPPYGDIDNFKRTVDEIHKRGHLIGLYASGLGITTQGVTDKSYINQEEYETGGWKECVCKDYEQQPIFTDLGFVRSGYDVCPSCKKVKDVMIKEALKIAQADIDYYQAFDQNLGGLPRFCWDDKHNHPSAPGSWISKEMCDLFEKMQQAIENSGKKMVFGCELAASEPAIKHLPFNDLRWFTAFRQGIPVPAYSFIYHEYINNYMGNQNGLQWMLDLDAAKDNLLYRTVYSFLAGDMLTVVLGADGKIGWCWNAPFDGSYPDSKPIIDFIKNANMWRKGFTKKYLRYGKVLQSHRVDCPKSTAVVLKNGKKIIEDNIMNRKFQAEDGTVAEFFVNRTTEPQLLKLEGFEKNSKLYTSIAVKTDVPESIVLDTAEIVCVIK